MTSLRAPLAALLFLLPLSTGCSGCNEGEVQCDAEGNCQICDSYGCHNVESGSGGTDAVGTGGSSATSNPSATGSTGGSGVTGTGTGSGSGAGGSTAHL